MYKIKRNMSYVSAVLHCVLYVPAITAAEAPQGDKEVDKLAGLVAHSGIASKKPTKRIKKKEKKEKKELNKRMAASLFNLLEDKTRSQKQKIERLRQGKYGKYNLESVPHPLRHENYQEWFSPICVAADNGEWQVVYHLLGTGVSVNTQDPNDWTALHYAANQESKVHIQLLIRLGAKPEMEDSMGMKPLDVYQDACQYDEEIVSMLSSNSKTDS